MKNFKFLLILMFVSLLIGNGCRKDEEILRSDLEIYNGKFVSYSNWSETERKFFSIRREGEIKNRTVEPIIFDHPLMVIYYNYLAKENERHNFVDKIGRNVGIADWANSYIFMNKHDKSNTLLLPLKGINKEQVTGIISFNIIQNEVIINAFSRKSIEESIKVNCKDYYIAKSFDLFDKKIYGHASTDIQEYYCECIGQNETDIVLTSDPCEWKLIKLCTDLDSQTGWQGSRPIYPPIWDHDMDGIMNERDPDWEIFLRGFVDASAAQDYIRTQWNNRFEDRWGSYEEFWDLDRDWFEFDHYNDFYLDCIGCGITFEEWFDFMFDWLIDRDHDDIPFWNDNDDDGNGIDDRYDRCPWDVKPDKNNNNSRNIICDWYYVKDCNGASNGPLFEWWNDFDDMIDVPCEVLDMLSENQAEDAAQMFQDYINSSTTVHPCTGQPLNKEEYMDQICDPDMIEIWSNDQQFLNGSFLTPEVYVVLEYDEIINWANSHGNSPQATEIKNLALLKLCNSSNNPGSYIIGSGNDFDFPPDLYVVQRAVYAFLVAKHNSEFPNSGCDRFCRVRLWLEAGYLVYIDPVHVVLDICGLVPLFGEACDGINGVLYLIQGDGINASISFAATLPFGGWTATAGKYIAVAIKTSTGKTINLTVKLVNGLVDFGYQSYLRKVLELPVGDPRQAHHLISWSKLDHDVVQIAARGNGNSKAIYHMNRPTNGLAVDAWRQAARPGEQAGHILYNNRVEAGLEAIKIKFGLNNPDILLEELGKFENYLKNIVNANSNKHLNDIVFTYNP